MIKSQQSIIVSAPAKLNFTFEILGSLPDGYHQVQTLMQAIDLQDTLRFDFEESVSPGIELALANEQGTIGNPLINSTTNQAGTFPLDQSNLIAKAYALMQAAYPSKLTERVSVTIDKQIPIAAGCAGGSADAAACLTALNQYLGNVMSHKELLALGSKLGADVPFCLGGGLAIGTGRGDNLEAVTSSSSFHFLVIKAKQLVVPTALAYQLFDQFKDSITLKPNLQAAVKALADNDPLIAIKSFGNIFQPLVFKQFPLLAEITNKAIELGAWHCQLTGSGPTLFAIVADTEAAHSLRRKLQETFTDLDYFICRSNNAGAKVVKAI